MKTKMINVLTILFFFIALAFFFLSYQNFSQVSISTFEISKKNSLLSSQRENYDQKIIDQESKIKEKKIKISSLEDEIKKLDSVSQKANIEQFIQTLETYILDYDPGIYNFNYANHTMNNPGTTPLDGAFIESKLNREQIIDNLSLLVIFANDYNLRVYNSYVSKNNAEIFKNMGILDYLEKGQNFLIKSQLLEKASGIERFKQNYYSLLHLRERQLDMIENIFGPSASSYLTLQRAPLERVKASQPEFEKTEIKKEDLKTINRREVFAIEILNSSCPYLNNFHVTEEGKEKILKEENQILMKQEINENIKKLTYYNNRRGEISSSKDFVN